MNRDGLPSAVCNRGRPWLGTGVAAYKVGRRFPWCITPSTCCIWTDSISAKPRWKTASSFWLPYSPPATRIVVPPASLRRAGRGAILRYSDHFPSGTALYQVVLQHGLEGIVAKRRRSAYVEKRSRDWLKIKITQRQECVIGGYTEPRGSREYFGSLVLGLYDRQGRLLPVGQAGSGFTQATHQDMWLRLKELQTNQSPFSGPVQSPREVHWVRPELVAEIQFAAWTGEGGKGQPKLRAPVYAGLRFDKSPRECRFEPSRGVSHG